MNIRDVAKIAGVGVSTVSRVLNNHPDVGPETRDLVLRVLGETGYVPNSNARDLKRTSSAAIGVMIKGRHNPFFIRMIESIERVINQRGYSMILHYNHDAADDIGAAVELIKAKRLEGLICLGGNFSHIDDSYLLGLKTPLVLASADRIIASSNAGYASVIIENERAAQDAVSHLIQQGHRRIGLITSEADDIGVGALRRKGYDQALQAQGIPLEEDMVAYGLYGFEEGYGAAKSLLQKHPDMTALFAISDILAIGAMRAIREQGLRVPEDVAVVGFDGLDYAEYCYPALTTVQQPIEEIGLKSVGLLFEMIDQKSGPRHLVLQTTLVVRESSVRACLPDHNIKGNP